MKKKRTAFESVMAWLSYKDDLADPYHWRMTQISSDRKKLVEKIKGLIGEEEWQKHYDAVTPQEMADVLRQSEKNLPSRYTPAPITKLSPADELKASTSAVLEGTLRRLVTIVIYVVFFYIAFKVLMFIIS